MDWRRLFSRWRIAGRDWQWWLGDRLAGAGMQLRQIGSSRVFRQTTVSLVILGLVLALQALPFTFARNLEKTVASVVTRDYDFVSLFRQVPSLETMKFQELPLIGQFFRKETVQVASREKMVWPVAGKVTSAYGWRLDPATKQEKLHEGLDIEAPQGTSIKAALSGSVLLVRDNEFYGRTVILDHGNGLQTLYAHCAEILVREKEKVRQGDVIARVGKTGNATSFHLHFEVREGGKSIDPRPLLPALGQ
ncbi:MAG: M23 family metallopeptidase [Firmicutes bacterium]|nr:M23 family metallopeptidase [Bacillota bacterium]MCL5039851.1 M23 family metallopeptidase [Bacillota bacterium]